jgi:GNAT superfamily N-acetyltransferase
VSETDVRAFSERVMPFLLGDGTCEHEAAHNLMLGHLTQHARGLLATPIVDMAWAEHDGAVAAAMMRVGENRVQLARAAFPEAAALLARWAAARGPVVGVIGPNASADAFAQAWAEATGGRAHLYMAERIFLLDRVIAPPARPGDARSGDARPCTEADLDWVTAWFTAFAAEADPGTPGRAGGALRAALSARLAGPPDVWGMWAWVVDGEPVAMAGQNGPTPHSIRIGPVYTPPHLRGRGYASALCAALCTWLLEYGFRFITLFTDLSNPTSNHIYQAIGFRPVIDVNAYTFTPPADAAV